MTNTAKNAPMSSAPFIYDKDGNVAWDKMWNTFCYLAIEGGPPHRDTMLLSKRESNDISKKEYAYAAEEIIRAYKQLIPYRATHNEKGWIKIVLWTPRMAKWYADIINRENVECRQQGRHIFLPLNDDFTLKQEIKNVVTVMTKAYHYWKDHRERSEKICIMIFGLDVRLLK